MNQGNPKSFEKVPKLYHCEKCNYQGVRKSQWERHLLTKKHNDNKMITNDNEKVQKVPKLFHCEICDYQGVSKSQWERHLLTKKHKNNKMVTNDNEKVRYKCLCGKSYKFNSGYSRHKNVCTFVEEKKEEPQTTYEPVMVDLLKTLMCENKKLHEQLSVNALVPKTSNTTINQTNNTNSNNKIINVQLFLSEKCADAMSIQHFAKQLEITLDDVCKNKKDCITNVVLKNLKPLSLTERPFHCTNPQNKEWYIKDENDGWEEDTGEKLIKNTEDSIMKKWMCEFESHYPKWMENDKLQEEYVKIAGSTSSELPEKIKLKLLRELAGEVPLTSDDMC